MVTCQTSRLGVNCSNIKNKVYKNYVFLTLGLLVLSLFYWMCLYSQTVHVAHVPTNSITTVLLEPAGASKSREEKRGVSSQGLVEGRDDAAKKRAMDLESAKKNIVQRDQIINDSVRELNQIHHVVNHTPAKYFPLQHWNHFPDIWIVCCFKAGTSQLFRLLTHHPNLQAFHPSKEFCMDNKRLLDYSQPNEELYASLYAFHSFMNINMTQPDIISKKKKVTACLRREQDWLNYLYIQKFYFNSSEYLKTRKFIIIVRDPADLLFSMFNFWSQPTFDVAGERQFKTWAYEHLDYRSPELFHELIVSGNKTLYGRSLKDNFVASFGSFLSWIHLVGRENVLVIKNEDLLPEKVSRQGGSLDQLSSFLGIDRDLFDAEILKSRTNCNDGNLFSRGIGAKCKDREFPSTSLTYPISGNRAMLPKTRKLIYIIASEACQLLTQYFDHVQYDDCLQSVIEN